MYKTAKKLAQMGFDPVSFSHIAISERPGKKAKKTPVGLPKGYLNGHETWDEFIKKEHKCLAIRSGLSHKGDFLVFLDHDDYTNAERVRKHMKKAFQIEPFQRSPNGGYHYILNIMDTTIFNDIGRTSMNITIDKIEFEMFFGHLLTVSPSQYEINGTVYRYEMLWEIDDLDFVPHNAPLEMRIKNFLCQQEQNSIKFKSLDPADDEDVQTQKVDTKRCTQNLLEDQGLLNDVKQVDEDPDQWKALFEQIPEENIQGHENWKNIVLIAKRLWEGKLCGLRYVKDYCKRKYGPEYDECEIDELWERSNSYEKMPGYSTLKKMAGVPDDEIISLDPNEHIVTDEILPYNRLLKEFKAQKVKIKAFRKENGEKVKTLQKDIEAIQRKLKTTKKDKNLLKKMQTRYEKDFTVPMDKMILNYIRVAQEYSKYIIFQRTEGKLFAWLLNTTTTPNKDGTISAAYRWSSHEVNKSFMSAYDIEDESTGFSVIDHLIKNPDKSVQVDTVQNIPGEPLLIQRNIKGKQINILNIWEGRAYDKEEIISRIEHDLTAEEIKKYSKRIKKHIYTVLANGVDKEGEYIENWLACRLNDPNFFPGAALSFTSLPGSGKTTFFSLIFSEYFASSCSQTSAFDPTDLGADTIYIGKDLTIVDEIQMTKKDAFNKLKTLITDRKIRCRKMYRDTQVGIHNNTCWIFNSNHIDPFPHEGANQRRLAKFRCSDKFIGNEAYFDKLYDEIPSLFFPYYFIKMWTDDFAQEMKHYKFRNPKTTENNKSKISHLPLCVKFSLSLAKDVLKEDENCKMSIDDLYDHFVVFCDEIKVKHYPSKINFARNEDLQSILIRDTERSRVRGVKQTLKILNSIQQVGNNLEQRYGISIDDDNLII
jgi:hypothetical protein